MPCPLVRELSHRTAHSAREQARDMQRGYRYEVVAVRQWDGDKWVDIAW